MALIKCPECGKDVSTEAEICPYCGYPIKKQDVSTRSENPTYYTGSAAPKKKKNGCLTAFLIVLGVLLFLYAVGSNGASSSGGIDNTESWAKTYAKLMVKDNLKSPSTAKFCNSATEMVAKNLGGYKWRVTGWVDSQNSFGATVRSDFVVTLTLSEKGATCNDIDIKTRR